MLLQVDPTGLAEGLHYAEVIGISSSEPELGPIFRRASLTCAKGFPYAPRADVTVAKHRAVHCAFCMRLPKSPYPVLLLRQRRKSTSFP